tara:strand:+ start:47 stop:646 length:600 start_codon:yes stop_codon:yes gene_type:complete
MAVISNGTTLIDNGTLDAAIPSGAMTLLSTQTASASATISFTSGIDSTYDSYVFKCINIHPATDGAKFQVNFRDGDTAYDAVKTSTAFSAYHTEAASSGFGYLTGYDLAQSTGVQQIDQNSGNDNDQNFCAELKLFSPSSTTFVKHYIVRSVANAASDAETDMYVAGYCNVTAAIDGVQFSFSSGNIDSGVIKLYGIGA